MSKTLTGVFLFLALFAGIGHSYAGSEYTEQMLATRAYKIPAGTPALYWLEDLIRITAEDTVKTPAHRNENQIIIGDAYHWIGHIHEDRKEFKSAWHAHLKSFEAYAASSLSNSAFITELNTLDHARTHLMKVGPRLGLGLPINIRQFKKDQNQAKTPNTMNSLENYNNRLTSLLSSKIGSRCAPLFFTE